MEENYQTFDLIEEITRNDGSKYYEIGNILMNGRAEKAVIKNLIKGVKILQLNIPRSQSLITYEEYINENYDFPGPELDIWEEWEKPAGPVKEAYDLILKMNHIG